jgi:hypothetical protein
VAAPAEGEDGDFLRQFAEDAAGEGEPEEEGREEPPLVRLRGLLPVAAAYTPSNPRTWKRRLENGEFRQVLEEAKAYLGLNSDFSTGVHAVPSLALAILDCAMRMVDHEGFAAVEPLLVVSYMQLRIEVYRATVTGFKAAQFLAKIRGKQELEDPEDFLTEFVEEATGKARGSRRGDQKKGGKDDKKKDKDVKGKDSKSGGAAGERK